jgi:hypothetical protein
VHGHDRGSPVFFCGDSNDSYKPWRLGQAGSETTYAGASRPISIESTFFEKKKQKTVNL